MFHPHPRLGHIHLAARVAGAPGGPEHDEGRARAVGGHGDARGEHGVELAGGVHGPVGLFEAGRAGGRAGGEGG